jgi:hypothetical protein
LKFRPKSAETLNFTFLSLPSPIMAQIPTATTPSAQTRDNGLLPPFLPFSQQPLLQAVTSQKLYRTAI